MAASFQIYGGNCKFMLYSLLSNKFAKAMFYIEPWSVCSAPPKQYQTAKKQNNLLKQLVGVRGFEPPAPASRRQYSGVNKSGNSTNLTHLPHAIRTGRDWRGLERTPVQHIFSTRLKGVPTPFANNVIYRCCTHTAEGKNRVYIFTENITQLISDLTQKSAVLEFTFQRYKNLYQSRCTKLTTKPYSANKNFTWYVQPRSCLSVVEGVYLYKTRNYEETGNGWQLAARKQTNYGDGFLGSLQSGGDIQLGQMVGSK